MMTNEEWLKSLDTKELTEEIIGLIIRFCKTPMIDLRAQLKEWLKQEHRE